MSGVIDACRIERTKRYDRHEAYGYITVDMSASLLSCVSGEIAPPLSNALQLANL